MLTAPSDERPLATSRRQLIFDMMLGLGLAGVSSLAAGPGAAAQAKLSQADSGYQNRPNSGQRCELCTNWRGPTSCKVVAGTISPTGWCSLYVRNP